MGKYFGPKVFTFASGNKRKWHFYWPSKQFEQLPKCRTDCVQLCVWHEGRGRGRGPWLVSSTDGKIENYEQKGKTFVCVWQHFLLQWHKNWFVVDFSWTHTASLSSPSSLLSCLWLLATLLVRGSFSILFMALQVQVNMCDKRPHEAQWQSFILAKLLNKNASLLLYWNLSCVACSWTGCPVSDSSAGHLSLREIERRVIDGAGTETETGIGTARDCGWDRHSEIKRLAAVSAGNRLILSSFSTH